MKNLSEAKKMLAQGYTCVLVSDEDVITTDERGVLPLVKWIDQGKAFGGYSAADKVVDKAAALLYVILGVRAIWAGVMSKPAAQVLESYGIEYWYDTLTDAIINRKGDGFCPMETAVKEIDTPEEALAVIKNKLNNI
ncbi:MAG: DUF1893 domain-containing protein [Clostridia bacterium]|nr:DUF1893 domain-containing protein [Clostridia bacterium]